MKIKQQKNVKQLRIFWKLLEIHYTFYPDKIRC